MIQDKMIDEIQELKLAGFTLQEAYGELKARRTKVPTLKTVRKQMAFDCEPFASAIVEIVNLNPGCYMSSVYDVLVEGGELEALLAWAQEDDRRHVAISNPKFELFLVMHFEKGNGCTTSSSVDAAPRRHMPGYDKRLSRGQFSAGQVRAKSHSGSTAPTGSTFGYPARKAPATEWMRALEATR